MSPERISVTILVSNSSRTLHECLSRLKAFDEVVIYLNNSTDQSSQIARSFPNTTIVEGPFLGFGESKNLAAKYARHDWILNIDADELVHEDTIKSIKELPDELNPNTVYYIKRCNYYLGQAVNHSPWGSDDVIRLYHRQTTQFNTKKVHESIMLSDEIKTAYLDGELEHYSYGSSLEMLKKNIQYSELYAQQYQYKKRSNIITSSLHALMSFFKSMVLKGGFLDGLPGWVINWAGVNGTFFKYVRLAEKIVKPKLMYSSTTIYQTNWIKSNKILRPYLRILTFKIIR
ncbi:glycosyltransferase family 2 protein [Basilea psittacipulmonis]|nr:glycosyltransferase family 2 protein [Basilea psittacipulmonis]